MVEARVGRGYVSLQVNVNNTRLPNSGILEASSKIGFRNLRAPRADRAGPEKAKAGAMPQEKPAWMAYSRELKIMRASTLGKHSNEFASKNQIDELFDNADGPDKSGAGVLSFIEMKKALMEELRDRTRLKNSDNLVQETVTEALRRAYNATKNLVAQGGDPESLDREEMRIMLVYLVRVLEPMALPAQTQWH